MRFLIIPQDHHHKDAQKNAKIPHLKIVKSKPTALNHQEHVTGQDLTSIKNKQTTKPTLTLKRTTPHGKQLTLDRQPLDAQHLQNPAIRHVSSNALPDHLIIKEIKNGLEHLELDERVDKKLGNFVGYS